MYGAVRGYFTIEADSGNRFVGRELLTDTGFGGQLDWRLVWKDFDGDTLVGKGDVALTVSDVVGFADAAGFTSLRFTTSNRDSILVPDDLADHAAHRRPARASVS